eukprot:236671-Prorocentrum_minimum.AAC.6
MEGTPVSSASERVEAVAASPIPPGVLVPTTVSGCVVRCLGCLATHLVVAATRRDVGHSRPLEGHMRLEDSQREKAQDRQTPEITSLLSVKTCRTLRKNYGLQARLKSDQ